MEPLRFLFSPNGRLQPRAFWFGAAAVYLAGLASQWLTVPDVIAWGGLWPFMIAQALLIWVWFSLHAKRLRDCGHSVGIAVGISLLYALSVVLLVTVAAAFFDPNTVAAADANTASALGLILLLSIIAILIGSPHYDFAWLMVALLTAMALVPVIVGLVFSAWTARRPSSEERTA